MMWLRVAEFLHATPSEAKHRCTLRDFREIAALWMIDPWGRDRSDLHAGIIASTVANASGSRRKFAPKDFMPKIFQRKKSDEELGTWFAKFAEMHNALRKAGGDG
jgi:hypothetical protein